MRFLLKKVYLILLTGCKYSGLFEVAKMITKNELRILCYHNFSSSDVLRWSPPIHIKPETFRKRIEYITKCNFSLLRLADAIKLMRTGDELHKIPVVITIDDGWESILKYAHPILHSANVPYTVYVTSWYSINNQPIFNLAVPFVLWKAQNAEYNFRNLNLPITLENEDIEEYGSLAKKIIDYGINELSYEERYSWLEDMCEQIGVDYSSLKNNKELTLLDTPNLEKLYRDGVDIQLHTHSHSWPLDENAANSELSKNRTYLEKITKKPLKHFCYPSGSWDPSQFVYLKNNGIESATTCDDGFNNSQTNIYALNRLLDSEEKAQIVFEAELSGFVPVLNKFGLSKIKKWFK